MLLGSRNADGPAVPPATTGANRDLAEELLGLTTRSFTGAVEVTDKATKARAHVYFYEGGVYAIDLDGYRPPIFARLKSSGLFADRSGDELAVLERVDIPDARAIADAAGEGWLTVEALANVHQEILVASLGAVLALSKVKTRVRKAQTSARFCALPVPVSTLIGTIRMRADRLDGTWGMVAPGISAETAVLRHVAAPVAETSPSAEVAAMANAIDGIRTLDGVAADLGFTRAEAVHIAAGLLRSGRALIDADAVAPGDDTTRYLVPEAFGSHKVMHSDNTQPAEDASVADVQTPDNVSTAPTVDVEEVVGPTLLAEVGTEQEQRLHELRVEVARLHEELQSCVRAEQYALNRTAEVSERLRQARVTLAQIEMAEALPAGIA